METACKVIISIGSQNIISIQFKSDLRDDLAWVYNRSKPFDQKFKLINVSGFDPATQMQLEAVV